MFLKDPAHPHLGRGHERARQRERAGRPASLEELSEGRTTLVIAHRLSTIRGADLIAVVEDGRVVEQGTHDELLELGGTYARYYEMQFGRPSEGL